LLARLSRHFCQGWASFKLAFYLPPQPAIEAAREASPNPGKSAAKRAANTLLVLVVENIFVSPLIDFKIGKTMAKQN